MTYHRYAKRKSKGDVETARMATVRMARRRAPTKPELDAAGASTHERAESWLRPEGMTIPTGWRC